MKRSKRKLGMFAAVVCLCLFMGLWNVIDVQAESKRNSYIRAVFDADYYYNTYPDLQAAIGKNDTALFNHLVRFGLKEGRASSAEFNISTYMANYADLVAAFGTDYPAYCEHYIVYGKAEGRTAGTAIAKAPAPAAQASSGTVLGTCTTSYDATVPRASNIVVAVSRINGVTVQPGAAFSFSQAILPRTAENGYVVAPIFSGGRISSGIGGGICQVSSTLYVAMLNAGMPATERHAHSLPVSYLPAGMDATISGTVKDLKFTNVFSYPVQIQAAAVDGSLTVTLVSIQ